MALPGAEQGGEGRRRGGRALRPSSGPRGAVGAAPCAAGCVRRRLSGPGRGVGQCLPAGSEGWGQLLLFPLSVLRRHRITDSLRLEKTTGITESKHQPTPTVPTARHPHGSGTPPGTVTAPPPWAARAAAAPLFPNSFLISNLNLPWPTLRPSPLILSLLAGRRGRPPPRHIFLSGHCRER